MSAKSRLILSTEEHERVIHDAELDKLYESDNQLRALADEIHARRMLPPPTCSSCIEMALDKLSNGRLHLN